MKRSRIGFTLIELLTVIAIITLLIGILVPALSRARQQARSAATRAVLKSAGDGLDMFKNDNPKECRRGGGYPSASMRDDPTEESEQRIFGGQWLVRYLLGKTMDGYIPKRNVPRALLTDPEQFWEQKDWYALEPTTDNAYAPLERVGPYLEADGVTLEMPKNIEGYDPANLMNKVTETSMEQPVLLDNFGYPVLYFTANTSLLKAQQALAPIAGYDDSCEGGVCLPFGVYTFSDNGFFTGMCEGSSGTCVYQPWDFIGVGFEGHKLKSFGTWANSLPDPKNPSEMEDPANAHSFPVYIMNKEIFNSTDGKSVVPYRKETFILLTPGPDGVYGTKDDVSNF